jgi:hypothetical protein
MSTSNCRFLASNGFTTAGLLVAFVASTDAISAATLGFEGLADGTSVTSQYPGLTFSNATVLTADISLNEFEFPPHSGANVVADLGGPISIDFGTAVSSVSAYFTYTVPLTLTAFNVLNEVVSTAHSQFANNLACLAGPPCSGDAGSSPNELMIVSSAGGIARVVMMAGPDGSSFAFDDLSYIPAGPAVPEPRQAGPIFVALLVMAARVRRRVGDMTAGCFGLSSRRLRGRARPAAGRPAKEMM